MRYVFTAIFLLSALPSAVFASSFHGTINADVGLPAVVITAPSASPAAGTYTSAQSVTLSAEGSDSIRYTTDGSTPSCADEGSDTLFSSPIDVPSSLTIQAISCYSDESSSSVVSFSYVISPPASPSTGGGGNGPIAGSLPSPGAGNAPAPSPETGSAPVVNDTPSAPPVVTTVESPQSLAQSGTIAGASTSTVRTTSPPSVPDTVSTSSQVAAAVSAGGEGFDYWWMLLLLFLFLLLDAWWVLNSRKFPQVS